jgi:adenylate cyclase, class 2
MQSNDNREIECRFLEIDKAALIKKLHELGAEDKGEVMLEELVVYDEALTWRDGGQHVRIRKSGDTTTLSFKKRTEHTIDGTQEIELIVSDFKKTEEFLRAIGLRPYRCQQKYRHTFFYKDVTIDIDTWPRVPTYVEFEGPSEKQIRNVVDLVGYDWKNATTDSPRKVIEERYGIPVSRMTWFTFDRFE